jgi:hypothetical protein
MFFRLSRIKKVIKTQFLVTLVLAFASTLCSITIETASFKAFLYGPTEDTAYDNWLSKVVEGRGVQLINHYAPWDQQTVGFGNYVQASSEQLDNWQTVIDFFIASELDLAQIEIDSYSFPYEVVVFHDTDTGRTYHILRELVNYDYYDDNGYPDQPEIHQHGSFDYGWGLYVINPNADNHVILNIVHPKDDFITVPIAAEALEKWNSRYLFIAGAGREVLFSGPNHNNYSLSDPSRVTDHPFNTAYRSACDEIRSTFQRRELSIQLHSYDLGHSREYRDFQFSTHSNYHSLPLRDMSNSLNDFINATPYVVFPANTFGVHDEVLVTDYYSATSCYHDLYYNLNGELIPISDNINLPGFSNNRQAGYSTANTTIYDVNSPFLHLEMRELPRIYPNITPYYRWFYGYNEGTQRWNKDHFYTRAKAYYTPWVDAMAEVLPDLIELDDGTQPTAPQNLMVTNSESTSVSLGWDRSYSYDFYSYEVYYSTEPITFPSEFVLSIDRTNVTRLAAQAYTYLTIDDLTPSTDYYFRVLAKDYNGNVSNLSNQVTKFGDRVVLNNFGAFGRDSSVDVKWRAAQQVNNLGFKVYRALADTEDFTILDSWETNSSLEGSSGTNVDYIYTDNGVTNNIHYDYRITWTDTGENEHTFNETAKAEPQPIFSLLIRDGDEVVTDQVDLGVNHFATDGYDANFDIVTTGDLPANYVRIVSHNPDWNWTIRNLQRDIRSYYNPEESVKSWLLRVDTNVTDETFTLLISDNFTPDLFSSSTSDFTSVGGSSKLASRQTESLFLKCHTNDTVIDLLQDSMEITFSNDDYHFFTLFWGYVTPDIVFTPMDDTILIDGDQIVFSWTSGFPAIIESFDLMISYEDNLYPLAENLPSTTTSFCWTVPAEIQAIDARFLVRVNTTTNQEIDYYSPYRLSLWPHEYTFSTASGWHLKANPILGTELCKDSVFGINSQLFEYSNDIDHFDYSDYFVFGTGYVAYLPQEHDYSAASNLHPSVIEIELQQGWNLVPNVFLSSVALQDLSFWYFSQLIPYAVAVQLNLINGGVYSIINNQYQLVQNILPEESVWIYSHLPELTMQLNSFPNSFEYAQFESVWDLTVKTRIYDEIRDNVIIGASLDGNLSNPLICSPKPPPYPGQLLDLSLNSTDDSLPYSRMHREIKSAQQGEFAYSRYYDFTIHVNPLMQPIYLSWESLTLPDHYRFILIVDELFVEIESGVEYPINPTSNIINGQFLITNQYITTTDENLPSPNHFYNYPNPFSVTSNLNRNNGTNINFSLTKQAKVSVDIFNIKGQKVINLLSDVKESGNHSVFWDGKNNNGNYASSGVYFYRLAINGQKTSIKKMLLLN